MKASERLRKAAADPTIIMAHDGYFIRDNGTCRACAVGAMVACCEAPAIIDRVYFNEPIDPDSDESEFFGVVATLAPSLVQQGAGLACPLADLHSQTSASHMPTVIDDDDPYGYRYLTFHHHDRSIAHMVEHLFEDHRLDYLQIADLIEPLGY